jgi:hypothetical protein
MGASIALELLRTSFLAEARSNSVSGTGCVVLWRLVLCREWLCCVVMCVLFLVLALFLLQL